MKHDYTDVECIATEGWISKPMFIFNVGLTNGIKRVWIGRLWGVAFLHEPFQIYLQRLLEIDEINELPKEAVIVSGLDIYFVRDWQIVEVYDAPNARLLKSNNIIIPPGLNTKGYGIYAKKIVELEKYEDLENIGITKVFDLIKIDETPGKAGIYVEIFNNSILWPVRLWRPGKILLTLNIQPTE